VRFDARGGWRGIPTAERQPSHAALGKIRPFHLRVTREVLKNLSHGTDGHAMQDVTKFKCR
jgi:hypothetical protein